MQRFSNKVVLITGAARGIGLATAEEFAREGGTVIATDRDEQELNSSVEALRAQGHRVEGLAHDVTEQAQWQRVIATVIDRHGCLDVLVNNAGTGDFVGIEETTPEQWRKVMAVNLEGVFYGMQAAIEIMKGKGGAIVNVASVAANVGEPMLAAYCASKGGVSMLTKAAAVDCARRGYGIRINSIHPGYTDTKLVRDALASLGPAAEQAAAETAKSIPMGRMGTPPEIAKPIVFLASDDASFMTGSELVVDGGFIAA